jgi:hypothetical protein
MGLFPNAHDPCFYTGLVWNSLDPLASQSSVPLSIGLYLDDFVYFSEDLAVEALFEHFLQECVKVDFMGLVEWFLGILFLWRITPLRVDVHLNQTDFSANLVEQFYCDSRERTPTTTPYIRVSRLTPLQAPPTKTTLLHTSNGRTLIKA